MFRYKKAAHDKKADGRILRPRSVCCTLPVLPECNEVEPADKPGSVTAAYTAATVIHLGLPSPKASSDLPESGADHTVGFLFGLAPGGVYLAAECCHLRGALLPHPFTLTCSHTRCALGGLLSAALSVSSRSPGVTWHPVLWSPDFPLAHHAEHATHQRLPGQLDATFLPALT